MAKKKKKKKQSVNVRMLVIIGIAVVGLIGVGGGLFWYQSVGRTAKNVRAGDRYFAEGDYDLARKYYGRVIAREDNPEVIEKLIKTYEKMVPITREEAQQLFRDYQGTLMFRAESSGANEEYYLAIADATYESARLTNAKEYWQRLQAVAELMTIGNRFSPDSEAYARGKLYLGLCLLRLRDGQLTENIDIEGKIRFPGESELMEHVELRPESDDGWANLAFGRMAVARKLGLEGRYGQEAKNLKMAEESFSIARERSPDGPAVALMDLRDLFIRKVIQITKLQNDSSSVSEAEIKALDAKLDVALDHAEKIVARDPASMPTKVYELLLFLNRVDTENGNQRKVDIITECLESLPENDRMRILLATTYYAMSDYEQAMLHAQQVLDAEQKPISLASLEQFSMRPQASALLFEIAYSEWASAELDERDPLFEKVLNAREQLDFYLGGIKDDVIALNADGKIAMGRGNYREASSFFERQIFLSDNPNADTLRSAAFCLEQTGMDGSARERLAEAIQADPMTLGHYIAKASLEGRMRRPEAGLATLESLPPGLRETNEEVALLRDSLQMLRSSQSGETATNVSDPVLRVISEADGHVRAGDNEKARDSLLAANAALDEPDERLLASLAQVESLVGNAEQASAYLDEAILLNPDSEYLRNMQIQLSGADPIEIIKNEIPRRIDDPDEQVVLVYVTLELLETRKLIEAAELERADEPELANAAREMAERAAAEADLMQASIDEMDVGSHPALYAFLFERSLREEDWETAENLAAIGREINIDETNGELVEARFHSGRAMAMSRNGDTAGAATAYEAAARAALRATQASPWSDVSWQTLGTSLDALGNREEALEAFEEAYRRNPGNRDTIVRYSNLLLSDDGEPLRALRMLREAIQLHPSDNMVRELWLQTESVHGERLTAITKRREIRKKQPGNRSNLMQLASLLVNEEPDRQYIVDESGNEVVSVRQWSTMSKAAKDAELQKLQVAWDKEVSSIIERIEQSEDRDMIEALMHASIYRDRMERDLANRSLQSFLKTQVDAPAYTEMVITSVQFLIEIDRLREALEILERARDKQDPAVREIDRTLGILNNAIQNDRKAVTHLRLAIEVSSDPMLKKILVESLVRLQQFQQAEQEILAMRGDGAPTYDNVMLQAMLAERRADSASALGQAEESKEARALFLGYLEEANRIDPEKLSPYIELTDSLIEEFKKTRDRTNLEKAIAVVNSGIKRLPDSDSLLAKRADVLEAQGELRKAILDLEQMSRKYPESIPIRERLIIAHLKANSPEKAQDVITDGIALMPEEGTWYEALGDYYFALPTPDLMKSTSAYLDAYSREPSRALLRKINIATRGTGKWDYDAMLELIQRSNFEQENDPVTIGLYARSLAGKGAYDQANRHLRRAYGIQQDLIDQGVLPESAIIIWYEDLFVVYGKRDGDIGEQLAMELAGENPAFWDEVGMSTYWAFRGGDGLKKAIDLHEKTIERTRREQPEQLVSMLNRLGGYHVTSGNYDEAVATYSEIIKLEPENTQALNNYAYLTAKQLGRPEDALESAKLAAELDPNSLQVLDTIATIYEMLGQYEPAMTSRLRLHMLYPTDLNTLLSISESYIDNLDDTTKALEFAELAQAVNPTDPAVLDMAGWVSYRAGQGLRGEDLIRQSIRTSPTASAHLHLAKVLMDKKESQKAREQLKLAEDLNPDEKTRGEIDRLKDDIGRS